MSTLTLINFYDEVPLEILFVYTQICPVIQTYETYIHTENININLLGCHLALTKQVKLLPNGLMLFTCCCLV